MKPNAFLIFIRQKLKIFGGFVAFTFILLNINILENAKNINIIKNIIKLLHLKKIFFFGLCKIISFFKLNNSSFCQTQPNQLKHDPMKHPKPHPQSFCHHY